MIHRLTPDQAGVQIVALRWMLWQLDYEEWAESPIDEGREEPPCPVTDAEGDAVLAGLAGLVIGARRALAPPQLDITDPEQVTRFTRDILKGELDVMERAARRAQLRAVPETGGGPGAA